MYARIVDKKVRGITEPKFLEEQGSFRKNRSCADQLFIVRQLGEQVIQENNRMLIVCAYLEKAYDRADREMLWQVVEMYGVSGRLAGQVLEMYGVSGRLAGQVLEMYGVSGRQGRAVRSLYASCQA